MDMPVWKPQVTPGATSPNALADVGSGAVVGNAIAKAGDQAGADATKYGVAAEQARRAMATATMTTGALKQIDDVEQSLQDDPDWSAKPQKYKEAIDTIRQNYADQTADDPTVQGIFLRDFDRIAEHRTVAFQADTRKQMVDDLTGQLDSSLSDLSTSAVNAKTPAERADVVNLAGTKIDLAAETGVIPRAKAELIKRNWLGTVDEAQLRGLITANPHAAVTALQDPDQFSNLNPLVRAQFVDTADSRAREADRQAQADAEKGRQQQLSDLAIAVQRGDAGTKSIEAAYNGGKGWLKPAERTELTHTADIFTRKDAIVQQGIQRVNAALSGDGVMDPKSDPDRKAVDNYFAARVAPDLGNADPATASTKIADFVGKTGIMPDVVRGQLRGSLRAGSDDAAAAAADLIDRVSTTNPKVLDDLSDEDLVLGHTIANSVREGVDAKTAVLEAREALKQPPAERKARELRMGEERQPQNNASWLQGKYTGGSLHLLTLGLMDSLPSTLPDGMQGEFADLYKQAFLKSGNVDTARAVALDRLRNWGVTTIGGAPRWMKYAPETVYGNAAGTEWIGEQLSSDLSKGSMFDGSTNGRVQLQADAMTAREMLAGTPSYQVLLKNAAGEFEPLRTPSRPGEPAVSNLAAADTALNLTQQEKNLYQYGFNNLTGGGAVTNSDGSVSTIYQAVVGHGGRFYNIPTVWGGKIVDVDTATKNASAQGWDKWPSYKTPDEADARYEAMHSFIEKDAPATKGSPGGLPLRWRPDFGSSPAGERARASQAATLETAKNKRTGQAEALTFGPIGGGL